MRTRPVMRWRFSVLAAMPLVALPLTGCAPEAGTEPAKAAPPQVASASPKAASAQQRSALSLPADLMFPPDGVALSANAQAMLTDISGKLKTLRDSKVVVAVYTDNRQPGGALQKLGIKSNVELSSRRAQIIANYLISQGVPAGIITATGRGDADPVAPNDTPDGQARNRRIEIALEGPGT